MWSNSRFSIIAYSEFLSLSVYSIFSLSYLYIYKQKLAKILLLSGQSEVFRKMKYIFFSNAYNFVNSLSKLKILVSLGASKIDADD